MTYGAAIRDEADLQARVATLAARHYGLLHYHTHDSRRSEGGFPDSVFVGRTVLFRELKVSRRSRVRPAQKTWIEGLRTAGADAGLWYAEDYHSGLIDAELAAAAPRDTVPGQARRLPPMAARLAKRLYLAAGDNPARAALLWEAGVASVEHARWIAQAQQVLAIVAEELPTGDGEHRAWLAAHHLPATPITAIMSALARDLTAPAAGRAAPADE